MTQSALQWVRVERLSETSSHHSESRRQLRRLTAQTSAAIRLAECFPATSAATPLTKAQTAHSMGTVIVSAALFVIVLVWLVVAMNLGKAPITIQTAQ